MGNWAKGWREAGRPAELLRSGLSVRSDLTMAVRHQGPRKWAAAGHAPHGILHWLTLCRLVLSINCLQFTQINFVCFVILQVSNVEYISGARRWEPKTWRHWTNKGRGVGEWWRALEGNTAWHLTIFPGEPQWPGAVARLVSARPLHTQTCPWNKESGNLWSYSHAMSLVGRGLPAQAWYSPVAEGGTPPQVRACRLFGGTSKF